jgi:hypothetical protein
LALKSQTRHLDPEQKACSEGRRQQKEVCSTYAHDPHARGHTPQACIDIRIRTIYEIFHILRRGRLFHATNVVHDNVNQLSRKCANGCSRSSSKSQSIPRYWFFENRQIVRPHCPPVSVQSDTLLVFFYLPARVLAFLQQLPWTAPRVFHSAHPP